MRVNLAVIRFESAQSPPPHDAWSIARTPKRPPGYGARRQGARSAHQSDDTDPVQVLYLHRRTRREARGNFVSLFPTRCAVAPAHVGTDAGPRGGWERDFGCARLWPQRPRPRTPNPPHPTHEVNRRTRIALCHAIHVPTARVQSPPRPNLGTSRRRANN